MSSILQPSYVGDRIRVLFPLVSSCFQLGALQDF